jgi:hypothetical protein
LQLIYKLGVGKGTVQKGKTSPADVEPADGCIRNMMKYSGRSNGAAAAMPGCFPLYSHYRDKCHRDPAVFTAQAT